ncbi:alpha/beta hydrolase family protein [Gemmatimonadota bacterium]
MNRAKNAVRLKSIIFCMFLLSAILCSLMHAPLLAAELPDRDTRHELLIDADNFVLRLPQVKELGQWETRKKILREKLMLSAGLWPPPERNALRANIFDKRSGEGFTVAKVYYESLPGYLATGNLYLPTKGKGPYPAVICPHGHWKYGRLTNSESGSLPGRYIDLARMGFVVLSIDMVGYNDCFQLPHDENKSRSQLKGDVPLPYEPRYYRANFDFPVARLYGLNLGGLQLWNCIRGVDLLCSLDQVDTTRIGATGCSGGASQTLMLMNADERIKVAAPVNIIGAAKHPGCRCENMPGLWVDMSTIELSATFAPRPLLLLSATEDPWTNKFPERELPIFKKYYSLFNAVDMVKNVHVNAGHNYNADSRAAAYQWFCRHLKAEFPPIAKPVAIPEDIKDLGDLRVFPDGILPEAAIHGRRVINNWQNASEKEYAGMLPGTSSELKDFVSTFRHKLALVLQLEQPIPEELLSSMEKETITGGISHTSIVLGRQAKGDRISLEALESGNISKGALLLVYPEEMGGLTTKGTNRIQPWIEPLLDKGYRVYRVSGYASGRLSIPGRTWDSFSWPWVYNRDNRLNGIQDILTALAFLKKSRAGERLTVAGLSRCGLLTAYAGAVFGDADRVLADLDYHDPGYDGDLLELLPVGSIKRVGDLRTAMLLLMQNPVTLLNPAEGFERDWYEGMGQKLGLSGNLVFGKMDSAQELDDLF